MNARRPSTARRTGAVTVETAFAIPVLIAFLFAGVEFSRANAIRHTVENAAYEGARRGILPGATAGDCTAAAQNVLDAVGLVGGSITVNPNPLTATANDVTVSVNVPVDESNSYFILRFFLGKQFASSISLPREKG